jgi:hypothetical protein
MSFDRTLSFAALAAATFVFVASAYAQPRAPDASSPAASSAQAEHKGMHKMTAKEREQRRQEMRDKMHGDKAAAGKDADDCMGMMDKHNKMSKAQEANDHDHAGQDKTATVGGKGARCGMANKH